MMTEKSYAERIADEKARSTAKLAELDQEVIIASQLPAPFKNPYMIHRAASDCPNVSYKVDTLREALAIAQAFPAPLDVSAIESGCLSIQPVGFHSKQYADKPARWEVYQGIQIRQSGGKGFYTAAVSFWCKTAGRERIEVSIDVERFPHKFRAYVSATYSRHGDVSNAVFHDSELRHLSPAERVKFNGGGADAFDIRYFFSGIDCLNEVVTASEAQ